MFIPLLLALLSHLTSWKLLFAHNLATQRSTGEGDGRPCPAAGCRLALAFLPRPPHSLAWCRTLPLCPARASRPAPHCVRARLCRSRGSRLPAGVPGPVPWPALFAHHQRLLAAAGMQSSGAHSFCGPSHASLRGLAVRPRRCSLLQAAGPLNSSLSCFFQFDVYPEAYCTGANLALDLTKFAVGV